MKQSYASKTAWEQRRTFSKWLRENYPSITWQVNIYTATGSDSTGKQYTAFWNNHNPIVKAR